MKRTTFYFVFLWVGMITAMAQTSYQSDFSKGKTGALPDGWSPVAYSSGQAPHFELRKDAKGSYLSLSGNGDAKAVAYVSVKTTLAPGTYSYKALFSISKGVNPQRNLLFQCYASRHDGIFKFYKLDKDLIEGRGTIVVTGEEPVDAELRVFYRFNAGGEVKLRSLSLTPAEPVQPRWVRFACTQGAITWEQIPSIAGQAAADKADLLLYPEAVSQENCDAAKGDTILRLLSGLAAKHRMYIAASVVVIDKTDGNKYNRGVLYDRQGKLAGEYDKIHPYSPEVNEMGITPGLKTDVFQTDFGKVGFVICYDSWFTDVTELMALKGAEVILFPNAAYYRSLIPARAADNGVRFVISPLMEPYGIFDTIGRDVQDPDKDKTVYSGGDTFKEVRTFKIENIGMLCADLDLNCSPPPHNWNGKMDSAPGGLRNRADQILYLDDLIKKEKERWWEEINN